MSEAYSTLLRVRLSGSVRQQYGKDYFKRASKFFVLMV
jgi:hypothetical protein